MVACVACKDRSRSFQTFNESVVSDASCVLNSDNSCFKSGRRFANVAR